MGTFKMKIAGHTGEITSLYESTSAYFRPYLTEDAVDFTFTVTGEHLLFEDRFLLEEAKEEGFKVRKFTDPFLERQAIQRAFAEFLLPKNVLLLHGSTVAVDGTAYLFTARSGTGKSTHTRLWREYFGSQAQMVNDDKPFLAISQEGVTAHGAPWSGKHGLDSNISVPLGGICLLERGSENRIRPMAAEDILDLLRHQSFHPQNPAMEEKLEALLLELTKLVPLWNMQCTKDPEAAKVAHAAMCAREYRKERQSP